MRNSYGMEYIGKKIFNLTILDKTGKYFKCRCDCGNETYARGVDIFRNGVVKTCGEKDCPYHIALLKKSGCMRDGFEMESKLKEVIENAGYDVTATRGSGDFGVDLIVKYGGNVMAIQCKKWNKPVGPKGVMEVYAGGAYYGCNEYCVFAPSGFTQSAMEMARVLGVQLTEKRIRLNYNKSAHANITYSEPRPNDARKTRWNIDGVIKPASEWCDEYGVKRKSVQYRIDNGMTPKEAIEFVAKKSLHDKYTAFGETKTISEFAKQYNIIDATLRYRVLQKGMDMEEALTVKRDNRGNKKAK